MDWTLLLLIIPILILLRLYSASPTSRYPAYPSIFSRASNLPYFFLLDLKSPGPTEHLIEAHKKLNSNILITGPERLHISNPSIKLVKQISKLPKAQSYSAFDILGNTTIFSERDAGLHSIRFNKVKKLFSKKKVNDKVDGIQKCVQDLREYLNTRIEDQERKGMETEQKNQDEAGDVDVKVNLIGLFRSFSIDSTTVFTLGSSYEAISELHESFSNSKNKDLYLERPSIGIVNDHFNSGVPLALCSTNLSRWISWIRELAVKFKILEQNQEEVEALGKFYGYVEEVVKDAREVEKSSEIGTGFEDEEDVRNSNYASRLGEDCTTDDSLVAEVSDMLFAGVESLSTTLSITLLHLFKSHFETPSNEVSFLTLLRNDLDSLPPTSLTGFPKLSELESLSNLQNLIREGLRISSPVPRSLDRRVTNPGLTLDDNNVVPGGYTVGISSLETNFNPDIFSNPIKFDPERWSRRKDEGLFFPFGLNGSGRSCLGQTLAMQEMTLVFAMFIQNFDIVPGRDGKIEIPQGRDWWNLGFENGEILSRIKKRR